MKMTWPKLPTYNHPQIYSASSYFTTAELDPNKDKTVYKRSFQKIKKYIRFSSVCQDCISYPKCIHSSTCTL